MIHCDALHGVYGVQAQATGFIWRDGTVSTNSGADFTATPQGIDVIVIDGVRSESSAALWYMTGSTTATNVSIRSVLFYASNIVATGFWILHNTPGLFHLQNVFCRSSGAVIPVVLLQPVAPLVANIVGLVTETTFAFAISPGASAGITVNVWGYIQVNTSDVPVAVTSTTIRGSAGQLSVQALGSGLAVKEGSNAKQGVATLAAGTVTVANTSVTATSRVQLTAQDNNTTGALRVSARTAGTSFTITSSNAGDTGVVAYEIFEPA
jgi:hypothetical protein